LHKKSICSGRGEKKGKPGKAAAKRKSIKMWIENRKCGVGECLVIVIYLMRVRPPLVYSLRNFSN
jgi:hypothetical protein